MGQPLHRILEEFPSDEPHGSFPLMRRLRPVAQPPPEPSNDQIAKAYARGLEEGQANVWAAAQAEIAAAREDLRQQLEMNASRFSERVVDELTSKICARLDDLHSTIADQIATLLVPVVSHALTEVAVREFVEGLRILASDSGTVSIEISGPQELIDTVWQRYCEVERSTRGTGPVVTFVPNEAQEVRVCVDDAIIESRLMAWISDLNEAVR